MISPRDLGATIVRTAISRTVIDVNRDPSGASLYPGQATTGAVPDHHLRRRAALSRRRGARRGEIAERRRRYFDPYHAALEAEIARLRTLHPARRALRLPFDPLGRSRGCSMASCRCSTSAPTAARAARPSLSEVVSAFAAGNGHEPRRRTAASKAAGSRGATARPRHGVHARADGALLPRVHARDAGPVSEADWPASYDEAFAAAIQRTLRPVLETCLAFARRP